MYAYARTIVLLLLAGAPLIADEPTSFSGETMGTTYAVKAYLPTPRDVPKIQRLIDNELNRVNSLMSTYLSDSEVSRFNKAPANEWFDVSRDTARVVEVAQQTSASTDGAFDITVGPLVRLWRFGPPTDDVAHEFTPPSAEVIEKTKTRVGYQKLEVRRDPPAIRKSVEGLEIDLSAIAKGYAVDRIWHALNDWGGIDRYMVEVGGEVRVRGTKPNGDPWSIAIEAPLPDVRKRELILAPRDTAIASSGDYRNFHEYEGVLYSHTIDPRTGRPVSHSLSGATVAANDCMTADAYATALMVMGSDAGLTWAENEGVSALLMSRTNDGVTRSQSSHFDVPEVTLAPPAPNNVFSTIVIAALVFGLVIAAMSVGVIVKGKRLQGSCGGLAGMSDDSGRTICDMCTRPSPECNGDPATTEKTEGQVESS